LFIPQVLTWELSSQEQRKKLINNHSSLNIFSGWQPQARRAWGWLPPAINKPNSLLMFRLQKFRKKILLTPEIAGGIITITSGRYYANITAQMNFSSGTLIEITLMRF
jgi:hypothetical protein